MANDHTPYLTTHIHPYRNDRNHHDDNIANNHLIFIFLQIPNLNMEWHVLNFKSSLINKNFEDIEGVFWRTKTFQVGVEGDDEVFFIFFIGLLLLIVAGYFLDKKIRGNKKSTDLINTKIKKSKTIKKTDEELLSEWNNKRSEL